VRLQPGACCTKRSAWRGQAVDPLTAIPQAMRAAAAGPHGPRERDPRNQGGCWSLPCNRVRRMATTRKRSAERDGGLVHRYLSDIGRHPLLSAEEERALAERYARSADPDAFQRLVTANLRLVVKMAKALASHPGQLLDLVQEGNLGLVEAVRRFDLSHGVKLCSYAGWWIRAFMLRYLMDNARVVRLGRTREDRQRYQRGELPPPDASLDDLGTYVDAQLAGHVSALSRPDLVVEQLDTARYVHNRVAAFGRVLDARDSAVFAERVLAEEPAPLRELGDRLSLSGERVRQIEKRLVARLRDFVQPQLAA
jgi:RNA polymerase sigma-32 factor